MPLSIKQLLSNSNVGYTGSQGDAGTPGATGYTGSQGPPDGYTGSKGDPGAPGEVSLTQAVSFSIGLG